MTTTTSSKSSQPHSSSPAGAVTGTMRAAVLVEPRRVEVRQVPLPEPGPSQVRVRLEGCGVCASNIPPWEGRPWFSYPLEPGGLGHEGWGTIDAVGQNVKDLTIGQRVTMLSHHAYAEFDLAQQQDVVPLEPELAGLPFPGEPLGCAVNIFRRSGIREGDVVAIVGIGFLGALLTQMAARAGARVLAISRRPWALELARKMGAAEVIPMDEHAWIIEHVKTATGGRLCDVAVEAIGKQGPLDLAGELTGERGRLIVAGYHQDGPRQVNMQMWNWRGLDVINAHERDPVVYLAGIRAALHKVTSGQLDPWRLYTHRFPLERLGEALQASQERPEGFLNALIVMA